MGLDPLQLVKQLGVLQVDYVAYLLDFVLKSSCCLMAKSEWGLGED